MSDTNGFNDHAVAHAPENGNCRNRMIGEAPEAISRRHGADEDAIVGWIGFQAGSVTQKGTTGHRGRRINRKHSHSLPCRPARLDERVGQT